MQRATIQTVQNYIDGKVLGHMAFEIDREMINAEFARVRELTPSVTGLLLSTADGRALASDFAEGSEGDGRRLAAIANSYLTLGETLSKEMQLDTAEHASICTSKGNVVLFRINARKPLTLTAVAKSDTTLAVLLYAARECARRIGSAL